MEDTTMPPVACVCDCVECMENKNCADCAHADGSDCHCEGCMCDMNKPAEPPMAM